MSASDFASGTRFFVDDGEPVSIAPDGVITNWFDGKPTEVPAAEFARNSPPSRIDFDEFSERVARYSDAQAYNDKPINISINDAPLDLTRKYTYATNDYLANGGDNMNFLKEIPKEIKNIKLRDMLFAYFKAHPEPLNMTTDGRVQLQK